jgi:CheY-like chemotaxis protein
MVHGVAAQSGGLMRMTSMIGEGTTVELWLPVSEAVPATDLLQPAVSVAGGARSYRVLVVDDDPLVVASTAAMLEDVGHVALEAPSAARALDMLRHGTSVDVVVTDHAMPGMTGAELARHIKQTWPNLPVILATGYAELPNTEDPGLPRLSKPYLQEELAAQVAKVVADPATNVISFDSVRRA